MAYPNVDPFYEDVLHINLASNSTLLLTRSGKLTIYAHPTLGFGESIEVQNIFEHTFQLSREVLNALSRAVSAVVLDPEPGDVVTVLWESSPHGPSGTLRSVVTVDGIYFGKGDVDLGWAQLVEVVKEEW